jgi:hypothetical protein
MHHQIKLGWIRKWERKAFVVNFRALFQHSYRTEEKYEKLGQCLIRHSKWVPRRDKSENVTVTWICLVNNALQTFFNIKTTIIFSVSKFDSTNTNLWLAESKQHRTSWLMYSTMFLTKKKQMLRSNTFLVPVQAPRRHWWSYQLRACVHTHTPANIVQTVRNKLLGEGDFSWERKVWPSPNNVIRGSHYTG